MLSKYVRRADSVISVVDTEYIVGNSLNEVFKSSLPDYVLGLLYRTRIPAYIDTAKFIDSLLFHDSLIIWPHKFYGSFKITNSKTMRLMWCCSPLKDIKYFCSVVLEVNELISRLPSILLLAARGLIKTCIGICSAGSLIDLLFLFHCVFVFLGCVVIDVCLCIHVYIYVSLINQISPFRSERCAFFWRSLQK